MTDADNLIRQLDEKDAEIGRLESLLDRARPLARKNLEQAAEIEELKAEIAALREAVKDFLCECSLVDTLRQYETWQITPGSMDELRKMVEETP